MFSTCSMQIISCDLKLRLKSTRLLKLQCRLTSNDNSMSSSSIGWVGGLLLAHPGLSLIWCMPSGHNVVTLQLVWMRLHQVPSSEWGEVLGSFPGMSSIGKKKNIEWQINEMEDMLIECHVETWNDVTCQLE